ncbi:MAG: prefoldin subunit [Nanoarchaeota archaeon]|nr:prefoldin subunit [Nanoarchaeota archaeon]
MTTETKIGQLQMMEHTLQNLLAQKQQVQSQLLEAESASTELKTTDAAYKIVGNVMIKKSKTALLKEAKDKTERLGIRMKSIEKQESQIKEKVKGLQDEVMADMKKND